MADMHREDIKAAIRKTGFTIVELAEAAGMSKQVLSQCLHTRASERGDEIIAEALGKRPHEIWPSRYRADGQRIRYTRRKAECEAA